MPLQARRFRATRYRLIVFAVAPLSRLIDYFVALPRNMPALPSRAEPIAPQPVGAKRCPGISPNIKDDTDCLLLRKV